LKQIELIFAAVFGLVAIVEAGPITVLPEMNSSPEPSLEESGGRVFMELDEALKLAFPKLEVKRSTRFLSKAQKARVKTLGGSPIVSGIIYPYEAWREDPKTGVKVLVGTAYFETHRVRSLRETMMFVVSPEGKILRAEVLAFYEPVDYMPNKRFYAQFKGKVLNDELRVSRGIKTVTGCTLSVNASAKSARRILAIHKVLGEPVPPKKKAADKGAKDDSQTSTPPSPN
jgi:electron transport complex protein RnfG